MEILIPVIGWPILIGITQLAKRLGLSKDLTIAFMTVISAIAYAIFNKFAPADIQVVIHELVAESVVVAGIIYQTYKKLLW